MNDEVVKLFNNFKVTGQRLTISAEEKRENDLKLIPILKSFIDDGTVTDFEDIGFCYWNISDNYALLRDGESEYKNHKEFYDFIINHNSDYLYWLVCDATQRLALEDAGYGWFWWDIYRESVEKIDNNNLFFAEFYSHRTALYSNKKYALQKNTLYYYEPALNERAMELVREYSMPGHFVDIKQSYVFGMFKALKKFDPAYGVPFLIFKEYYVKNEVEEYVSEMRRGYSMSSSDELKTARKAMALYIEYGYKSDDATVRRIAAAIGKNEKDTEEIIQRLTETVHYAEFYVKCFDEDGETAGEDVTCDLTAEPCRVYLGIYEEEAVFGAYEKLNYREREMIADHLGFCSECYGIFEKKEDENGKPFKTFRKGKAFVDLAAEHTLSSGGSAERICNAGYEKMIIDLAIGGYIHIVELRLKEKTDGYVIYEYCADHNNDWGEIRYDFGEDDYEVTRYVYADVKGGFFFASAGDWIMSQAKRNGFSKRKLIITKKL